MQNKRILRAKVSYLGSLRSIVGTSQEEISFPDSVKTIRDLLNILIEKHGDKLRERLLTLDGHISPTVSVLINGEGVTEDGLDKAIAEEPEVLIAVVPRMVGGRPPY